MTTLRTKLQLRPGQRISVVGAPEDLALGVDAEPVGAEPPAIDAVMVFVRTAAELRNLGIPAVSAGRGDLLAWIAYPKAGQLGTDLTRDVLATLLAKAGVRPVRQVAIDDVWSALRIRPAA